MLNVFAADCSNLQFFEGIGTKFSNGYNTNQLSFQEQVNHIRYHYGQGQENMVLVGHSQGGVRALAYASMYPRETAAVITIGSPVSGHPLVTNINVSVAALNLIYKTIDAGVKAADEIIEIITGSEYFSTLDIYELLNITGEAREFIETDVNFQTFVDMVKNKASYPGIEQLNPLGSFFANYINPGLKTTTTTNTVTTVELVAQQKKILTGYSIKQVIDYYISIKIFGKVIKIPVYKTVSTPIYKYITVYVPQTKTTTVAVQTVTVEKRIKGTYVAFIVGTNNDIVGLVESKIGALENKSKVESIIANLKTTAQIQRALAAGNLYKAVTGLDASTAENIQSKVGSLFTAAQWLTKAAAVDSLAVLMESRDSTFASLIGGAGDCVIPKFSQKRDIELLGGTKLLNGIYECKANHEEELSHDEIWGAGGGMYIADVPTVTAGDGYLYKLLLDLTTKGKMAGLSPSTEPSEFRPAIRATAR
jgi:hypothetical protein